MTSTEARTRVAWLLWCLQQGYVKAEDREILHNWIGDDSATLTADDAEARLDLLAMADEVIAAARAARSDRRNNETSNKQAVLS